MEIGKNDLIKRSSSRNLSFEQNLLQCNRFMFDEQIACDIDLEALSTEGSLVKIPAHKYVLISRNNVFRAMLCGPLAENKDLICIPDISSEALYQLLRYLYYGEADLDEDNVLELLNSSHKYMIPSLTKKCVEFLAVNIDSDNVCQILEYAHLYEENDLVKRCLKYIQRYTGDMLMSSSFRNVSRSTVESILSMKTLSTNEDILLDAVLEWTSENIHDPEEIEQNTLSSLIGKIRVTMLQESKLQCMRNSEDPVVSQMGKYLCERRNSLQNKGLRDNFPDLSPRLEIPEGNISCKVTASSGSSLVYNGRPNKPLTIITNEAISIHKVILLDHPSLNCLSATVVVAQNGIVLSKHTVNCNFCRKESLRGNLVTVNFPQPVNVEEGSFEIQTCFKFTNSTYGTILSGLPKCGTQRFGAVTLEFPDQENATPVDLLEFVVS